jgi:3-deoxy-D-manno-octulosonic-acid transferase
MKSPTSAFPDGAAGAAFSAYRWAGLAFSTVLPLVLSRRASRGKEHRARTGERYGHASAPRPSGKVVWVHAASVGETNAVLPLVRRICELGSSAVFTSGTVTSAKIAAERLPGNAVHQFAPIDIAPFVARFLDHWQPDLAIFAESELWPITMMRLADTGIPLVLVNATLSDRSFRGWRRFPALATPLFSGISLCLAQSRKNAERFADLGAPEVLVTGNLKWDTPILDADPRAVYRLSTAIRGRPAWVASSTHEGEEAIVGEAHRILRETHPDILTIVVPRHPQRGDAVRDLLTARGLAVAQRSRDEPPAKADIYLADTLGELGLFYRIAPIAFIANSLVPNGGHNPIEAVRLNAAVLHGPHVHNLAEIYDVLDRAELAKTVTDARSLAGAVAALIDRPTADPGREARIDAALATLTGALDATMEALGPFLAGDLAPR